MNKLAREQVDYERVADVVGEEIRRTGYVTNSCILAARVTGIVLDRLGVAGVEAVACEAEAFSPAYVAMAHLAVELGGRELTDEEAAPFVKAGAWRVQLIFGPGGPNVIDRRDGRGYEGHVVTLVDRAWMIDPMLAQMNRPEKHLIVEPPFAWAIDYDEACGKHGHVKQAENGAIVIHRLLPGRRDFRRGGDWRNLNPSEPPHATTIARILARLTAAGSVARTREQ